MPQPLKPICTRDYLLYHSSLSSPSCSHYLHSFIYMMVWAPRKVLPYAFSPYYENEPKLSQRDGQNSQSPDLDSWASFPPYLYIIKEFLVPSDNKILSSLWLNRKSSRCRFHESCQQLRFIPIMRKLAILGMWTTVSKTSRSWRADSRGTNKIFQVFQSMTVRVNVMANFMCQLGWATVPRYLVKYYTGCFCKGVF